MEEPEMSEEQWDCLVQDLLDSWRGMRPPHPERRDFEMAGQQEIMHVLAMNDDAMTAGALAKACQVSSARIAKALNQLEAQGIAVREADPADGRRTLVHLTQKGQALVDGRHRKVAETTKSFLKELGADDAQDLLRLLKRISEIAPRFYAKHCAERGSEGGGR